MMSIWTGSSQRELAVKQLSGKRGAHHYSYFRAVVGVADDSADPQELTFYVEVNGTEVVSDRVPVGAQHPIEIALDRSAVRLKIGIEGAYNGAVGVWVNARLES